MRRFKKWLALAVMTMGILSAGTMTAFAFTEETAQESDTVVVEETEPQTEATPFSVPGNGQLVDDKKDDDTKQFLTIRTKKGNTFFLVLDRSSNTENVYMLSMIDENDLAEFIEETETGSELGQMAQVVIPETEKIPVETEPEPETELLEEPDATNRDAMLLGALALAGVFAAAFFYKVAKGMKEGEDSEGEDLEFYDGGAYINEDEEYGSGSGEER